MDRHTLLPLDDCLYALQPKIPHLTRSTLHRCLQRHRIARLADAAAPKRGRFRAYPIGYVHVDIAEVHTEDGRLHLFFAIDRTSKFASAELHERATRRVAAAFLAALATAVPYRVHTVLTDNGTQFVDTSTTAAWQLELEARDEAQAAERSRDEAQAAERSRDAPEPDPVLARLVLPLFVLVLDEWVHDRTLPEAEAVALATEAAAFVCHVQLKYIAERAVGRLRHRVRDRLAVHQTLLQAAPADWTEAAFLCAVARAAGDGTDGR